MDSVQVHAQPSDVIAEEGKVIVEGPNGVAVTFVPDAAEETARRLLQAAAEARTQNPVLRPINSFLSQ
ncbi:MAG TPA: hypothetical protein VLK25_09355 [Allosphingosinicella sp.]|nr:hypothetical protein [Allosphingosinicella sp.]